MKNILILISLLFSINSFCQEYTLLEINSEWNRNKAQIEKVEGIKHVFALLEEQKPSFKEKVKSVPTVILYKDNHAIAQWDGGLSMKLKLTRKDILEAIEKAKSFTRSRTN